MSDQDRFLPANTVLNRRYVIQDVLGAGGFGTTYRCVHRYLQDGFAVKEFFPAQYAVRRTGDPAVAATNPETYRNDIHKFLNEARILKDLHEVEGIVRVLDFFEENNTAYLVMSYYANGDLLDYIERAGGLLQEDDALRIGLTLARALSKIHKRNLLHRDIKPANILFDDDRNPVLCDFGAARYAIAQRTITLTVILTPNFSPLEQYESRGDQGPWTDIYSLAATLYFSVTGQVPPDAQDRANRDTFRRARDLVPTLSKEFDEALYRGLQDRTEERPQTADDFLELLQARPGSIPKPQEKPRKSNQANKSRLKSEAKVRPKWWATVASVLVIAAIAAFAALQGYIAEAIFGVLLYAGLMLVLAEKFKDRPGITFWALLTLGPNVKLLYRAFNAPQARSPQSSQHGKVPPPPSEISDQPPPPQPLKTFSVVFLDGEKKDDEFPIKSRGVVICRVPGEAERRFPGVPCIVLRSNEVSRVHITIAVDEAQRIIVQDANSTNGTHVAEVGERKWKRIQGAFVMPSTNRRQYRFRIGTTSEIFRIE